MTTPRSPQMAAFLRQAAANPRPTRPDDLDRLRARAQGAAAVTTPATPPVDTDDLPPTQYLILEVLAARHRTSETLWTFPARLRSQMEALADLGLIGWKSGTVPKTVMAWLTDAGKAAALSTTYVSPNAEWTVRFRDGGVMSPNFTEAGARHRAQEMDLEAVWRPVGPWQSATAEVQS